MKKNSVAVITTMFLSLSWVSGFCGDTQPNQPAPLFLNGDVPPLVMLVMERDHKLYYEAYNDASDLNNDGVPDIRYTPSIDYYGYFDSYKCYAYATSAARFDPVAKTMDKTILRYHPEVLDALENHRPVVALESTLITHGLPSDPSGCFSRDGTQAIRLLASRADHYRFNYWRIDGHWGLPGHNHVCPGTAGFI